MVPLGGTDKPAESLFDEVSAEESIPLLWKSMASGNVFRVRVEGDYIYVDRETTAEERQYRVFATWEGKKEGNKWPAKMRAGSPCQYGDGVWTTVGRNYCTFNTHGEFTLVTPTRIEGWGLVHPQAAKFKCKTCTFVGVKRKESFVWIPVP